jgi:hypothetical protein
MRALQNPEHMDRYVDALVEARKKKGLPREQAADMVCASWDS